MNVFKWRARVCDNKKQHNDTFLHCAIDYVRWRNSVLNKTGFFCLATCLGIWNYRITKKYYESFGHFVFSRVGIFSFWFLPFPCRGKFIEWAKSQLKIITKKEVSRKKQIMRLKKGKKCENWPETFVDVLLVSTELKMPRSPIHSHTLLCE